MKTWEVCNSCGKNGLMPIMPGSVANARRCQECGAIHKHAEYLPKGAPAANKGGSK